MKTVIFDIEKFAIHDGPGIRTVVFMKGCPLHCLWCHNPESQAFNPELLFNPGKCLDCGTCMAECPQKCHLFKDNKHIIDRKKCIGCGRCADFCLENALSLSGRIMSVAEVMEEVMKDRAFYENSVGGITLSGGEPLAHFDFTFELLKEAKSNGLHTAVETCGFTSWEHIEKLLPLTDLWLWDIKSSPEKHQTLTGVSMEVILDNLKKLSATGAAIILRCPLIPGINDEEAHLLGIANLANELQGIQGIDLEPYHPLGENKAELLNSENIFHGSFVAESNKTRWHEIISTHTKVFCRIY